MNSSCPWCCESIPGWPGRHGDTCPSCGRPLLGADGAELRMLDLRYDRVRAEQELRFRQLVGGGVVASAGIAVLLSLAGPAGVVGAPVMVVAHLVAIRVFLLGRTVRLLGGRRRVFVRWITRLATVWIGGLVYTLAPVPVAGAILVAAVFCGITWLAHSYARWALEQELRRRPPQRWERVVLWTLAVITGAALVAALGVAVLVGWGLGALLG